LKAQRTDDGRRTADAAQASRVLPLRRLVALGLCAVAALLAGVAVAWGSAAPDGRYVGVAAGAPGTLTLSIGHGTLTAFSGSTARLVCTHGEAGPFAVHLSTSVRLSGDAFTFTVHTTPAHSQSMVVSVSGRRQTGDEITGTIAASLSGYQKSANSCRSDTGFETVPGDLTASEHPTGDDFGRGYTGGAIRRFVGHAGFDYANHRITQFNGAVDIVCPDHTRFPFLLDSAMRGLDPIKVNGSGAFAVSGLAPLAGRGNIVQFSLTGDIHDRKASGTVRAAVAILFPKLETCSSTERWSVDAR
jgi:hypothetical protein